MSVYFSTYCLFICDYLIAGGRLGLVPEISMIVDHGKIMENQQNDACIS